MWELLGLVAAFWIAIALTSRIWYRKKPMDIPYKLLNLGWAICLAFTFVKWWLFFIAVGFFWWAHNLKEKYKDEDEDFIYWPVKHKW